MQQQCKFFLMENWKITLDLRVVFISFSHLGSGSSDCSSTERKCFFREDQTGIWPGLWHSFTSVSFPIRMCLHFSIVSHSPLCNFNKSCKLSKVVGNMCLGIQVETVNLWDQKSSFTSIRSLNDRSLNSAEYQHLAMLSLRDFYMSLFTLLQAKCHMAIHWHLSKKVFYINIKKLKSMVFHIPVLVLYFILAK